MRDGAYLRAKAGRHATHRGGCGGVPRVVSQELCLNDNPMMVCSCCPCCGQRVESPCLEVVVIKYRLTKMEASILRTVWQGKGQAVRTGRIFDAMYKDDCDGGPCEAKMYEAFKVALSRLRSKLKGSGVGITNVGYRQGYCLILFGEHGIEAERHGS
ncbi:MAG: hypothetical protein JSC189_001021 [Candidatus Tokpelaia sp. JSC189]|nr:MAG: hypothetical protein JSC189_001021 [Candidatus Tokpelaia sp. JSC189]